MTRPLPQFGLVAYLRNLTTQGEQIAQACADPVAKAEIEDWCAELAGKCEAIEALFDIPDALK